MQPQPTLTTDRLLLRPFTLDDAPAVQQLAGAIEIAEMTASIPHPYEDGMAETWIRGQKDRYARGEVANFAIVLRGKGRLIGSIGLRIESSHERAALGYWVGKPYWGHGYCTEAARAVLRYGFENLDLHRIYATHFARNPASGRVMQKLGMVREGCLRQHLKKWDRFEDMVYYGLLRSQHEEDR
jgi:RimJ/RimL family protein N-acetyltransferase